MEYIYMKNVDIYSLTEPNIQAKIAPLDSSF